MLRYHVEVSEPAEREIEGAQDWIAADSPEAAERWADELYDTLRSLQTMPARCPLAPENGGRAEEIRQLLYGQYRILFTVRLGRVLILHVRHGARLPLRGE